MTHKGEPTRQEIDVSDVSQLFGLVTMKLYSYTQPKCSYMWVCHDSSVGSQTQRHHDYSCRSKMTYIVNIASSKISKHCNLKKQEAQLMLTNLHDVFIGQSRSPNIVPFHILGIVSYCAIVTLRCAIFMICDLKKCRDLEMGVRGHSRSLKVAPFDRLCMVSY